jgi:ElaB/YqjD/DUF883 family membrane-anchored ribosome-binding protein
MDDKIKQSNPSSYPPPPATTVGRMKDQFSEKVADAKGQFSEKMADVKERVSDFGRDAAQKLDGSRASAAGALEQTASSLQAGGNKLSGVAQSAADRIQTTANYVRETDLRGMMDDLTGVVKRYPGQALAAAAILGFLVARGLRSRD